MKTLSLLVALTLSVMTTLNAQPIEFLGIPIQGHKLDFYKKMSTKPYTDSSLGHTYKSYKGYFSEVYCEVIVYSTPITQQVHQVIVNPVQKMNHTELVEMLEHYTKLYDIKYGKGITRLEYEPGYNADNVTDVKKAFEEGIVRFTTYYQEKAIRIVLEQEFGLLIVYDNLELTKLSVDETLEYQLKDI